MMAGECRRLGGVAGGTPKVVPRQPIRIQNLRDSLDFLK
jgi:hypothetical protein